MNSFERFNNGFIKRGENDCWLWTKDTILHEGHSYRAHRFSFFVHNGFFPEKRIYHVCGNFKCVNPKHLYVPGDLKPYFDYHYKINSITGCWNWTGTKGEKGYGLIPTGNIKNSSLKVHRYSYELFKGKIEKSLHVLHKCDNPSCVNPEHLFLGTNMDNVKDKISKNRHHGWKCKPHK